MSGGSADVLMGELCREANGKRRAFLTEALCRELADVDASALRVPGCRYCLHRKGRLFFVSNQFVRFLGYQHAEEMIGRPPTDFVHPDDRAYIDERVQSIYHMRGPTSPALQRLLHRDGRALFAVIFAIPTRLGPDPAALAIVLDPAP